MADTADELLPVLAAPDKTEKIGRIQKTDDEIRKIVLNRTQGEDCILHAIGAEEQRGRDEKRNDRAKLRHHESLAPLEGCGKSEGCGMTEL